MSKVFIDATKAFFQNREDVANKFGYNNYYKELVFSFLNLCVTIIQYVMAKLLRPKYDPPGEIYISWAPLHIEKIKIVYKDVHVIDISYTSFDRIKLYYLSKIPIMDFIKSFFTTYNLTSYKTNSCYLIYAHLEFQLLSEITKLNSRVVTAGLNDRRSVYLSFLKSQSFFKLVVIQHGVLGGYFNQTKLNIDTYYYQYDFSLPYLSNYFKEISEVKKYEDDIIELQQFIHSRCRIKYTFISQPIGVQENLHIVDFLLGECSKEELIHIIPHPRDSINMYKNKYLKNKQILISKSRFENIDYAITKNSTLGIEYSLAGIKTIFVNLNNYRADFIDSGNFTVLNSFEDFKNFIHSNVKEVD